jgi:hypothetical protein
MFLNKLFNSLPIFKNLGINALKNLIHSSKEIEIFPNEVIIKEG